MVRKVLKDKKRAKFTKVVLRVLSVWWQITTTKRKMNQQRQHNDKGKKKENNENANSEKKCKHCGLVGHVRRSHLSCLKNKKKLVTVTGKLRLFYIYS